MSSPSLRDACTAHAREALAHGAHESAARWASLALSRRDVDDEGEGAAVASGRTSDGWRRDAIDLEIKGDALAARGDARGAAAAYRRAAALAARVGGGDGGRASASGRDAMDGDEMSGDEMTMKLVRTLMKIGDEEAVREAKECLESTPPANRTLENRLLAAKIARREGHVRAAVSAYKEVLAKWPFAIEAVVALAELGVKSMDARRALRKTASEEDVAGEDFDVLEAYATAYAALESDDLVTAQSHMQSVKRRFPNDPYMSIIKARIAVGSRDVAAATREYAAVRSRDPCFVEGMDAYGMLLRESGDARALNMLSSDLAQLMPQSAESWTCMAMRFDAERGGREDAVAAAEKAVLLNPQSNIAHLVLGSIYLRSKRYKSAVRAFNQCNAIKVSMEAYHGLVKAYLALASRPNAAMCAKQALKRSPQSALAWSLMGDVHAKNRDEYDDAIKAYEQALAYDPRHVRSVKALAALNIKIGKVHVARAILQRQLDDYQPSDENELVQLYCRLAQALMLSRQTADGVKYYTRALAIQPTCDIAKRALEKFEQTRNPEHAATMSDEDQEGAEDMMEEEDASRDGDWMVEGRTTSA